MTTGSTAGLLAPAVRTNAAWCDVGYQGGPDPAHAEQAGFKPLGPLRV